jgi:hypothetical protein
MQIWKPGVAGGTARRKGRGRQVWTQAHLDRLVKLAGRGASARQIGLELGRSPLSVRVKASRLGIALAGHEIRQGARRQARREGTAAVADLRETRRPATIKVTVDFDLSSLTRTERQALAERLAAIAEAEGEAARAPKESAHQLHGGRLPPDAEGAPALDWKLEGAVRRLEWEEIRRLALEAAANFGRGLKNELLEREPMERRRATLRDHCIAQLHRQRMRQVPLAVVDQELTEDANPFADYELAHEEELRWEQRLQHRAAAVIGAAVEQVMGPAPHVRPPVDPIDAMRYTVHARNDALEEERERARARKRGRAGGA